MCQHLAQPSQRAVANAVEGQGEERIRHPEQALQPELGVIGDPRPGSGGLEGDAVMRDDGCVLATNVTALGGSYSTTR